MVIAPRKDSRAPSNRAFNYEAVGASSDPALMSSPPPGFRPVEHRAVLGAGAELFAAASASLLEWGIQRGSGIVVEGEPVAVGVSAMMSVRAWGITVPAPCRVVSVVSEPRRVGFSYGTLRGHPESGEELFLLEHGEDDTVLLTIRAFSRPAGLWHLLAPALRIQQVFYIRRYLNALMPHASVEEAR